MVTGTKRLSAVARRERLLDAAEMLFGQRGFERVTVADVAEAAGVTAGLIYRYFESKQDLLESVYQRSRRRLRGSAATLAPCASVSAGLAQLIVGHGLFLRANLPLLCLTLAETADSGPAHLLPDHLGVDGAREIEAALRAWRAQGRLDTLDAAVAARLLAGAALAFVLVHRWDEPTDWQRAVAAFAAETSEFFVHTVAPSIAPPERALSGVVSAPGGR